MTNQNMEAQMAGINRKLDLVMEEINDQRLRRQKWDDLMDDVNIISKDIVNVSVQKLDNAGVELDVEGLERAGLKLIRNIGTINNLIDTMESMNDLFKDLEPIIQQMGLDGINALHQLEEKGYIDFAKGLGSVADKVVTHFTLNDINDLANNIVTILETVKVMTQPEMLDAANNAITIFKNIDIETTNEVSLFKAFRELNSKEGRKAIGIMITFMKNMANAGTKDSN